MVKKKQKRVPADRAHFVREAVIEALGEAELPKTIYVRQRHIREAYGFTPRYVKKLIENGVLVEKHFVFKDEK